MQLLDQNEYLLKLQLVNKRFEKCQLLNNIFSQENGVHVWQLNLKTKIMNMCSSLGKVRISQIRKKKF